MQLNVAGNRPAGGAAVFRLVRGDDSRPGAGRRSITAGEFRVSGNSFFQVNRFLLDALVEAALEGAAGETSALDLYAGVGLFTLPLARRFRRRDRRGIGRGSGARSALERRTRGARQCARGAAGRGEVSGSHWMRAPDFVLLDPPRAGLGKEMVAQLIRLRPRTVTIVACDPVTLARDLAGLTGAGFASRGLRWWICSRRRFIWRRSSGWRSRIAGGE